MESFLACAGLSSVTSFALVLCSFVFLLVLGSGGAVGLTLVKPFLLFAKKMLTGSSIFSVSSSVSSTSSAAVWSANVQPAAAAAAVSLSSDAILTSELLPSFWRTWRIWSCKRTRWRHQ